MEVTSVSPSATSPTEGDDLCEIDVTIVAIHSVALLISLCGLVGNGAVLWLIHLKDFKIQFFDLALVDFLFLLFTVPSALLFLLEDVSCSPIMHLLYLNFLFQLSLICYYWGLFRLFPTSAVVSMYKFCELCCCHNLPLRLLWVVEVAQYWATFALFTVIPTVTFQCPSHYKEHCRAAVFSMYTAMLLLFVVPMVISLTIYFIQAKRGSKEHQPERRDIVIFLLVLLIFFLSLCNFQQLLGYTFVSTEVVFLLNCIYSSIKPFIYILAGRCWRPCSMGSLRLSLQRVFEEPEQNTAHSNDAPQDTGV